MSAGKCCGQLPEDSPTGDADDFLLIGLQGSGKTLLGQRLRTLYSKIPVTVRLATTETNGSQDFRLPTFKGCPFKELKIRECGGSMQPLWKNWYAKPLKGIIFTLDVSDPSTIAAAAVTLCSLLQEADLRSRPVCLALTKVDLPVTLSGAELDMALGLCDLERQYSERLWVTRVSGAQTAAECPALEQLFDWMAEVKARDLGLELPARRSSSRARSAPT